MSCVLSFVLFFLLHFAKFNVHTQHMGNTNRVSSSTSISGEHVDAAKLSMMPMATANSNNHSAEQLVLAIPSTSATSSAATQYNNSSAAASASGDHANASYSSISNSSKNKSKNNNLLLFNNPNYYFATSNNNPAAEKIGLLHNKVLMAIVAHLDLVDIVRSQRVCVSFKTVLNSDMVWQQLHLRAVLNSTERHNRSAATAKLADYDRSKYANWREYYFDKIHDNFTCHLSCKFELNNNNNNNNNNAATLHSFSYSITLCNHSKKLRMYLPIGITRQLPQQQQNTVNNESTSSSPPIDTMWHKYFDLQITQTSPVSDAELEHRWKRVNDILHVGSITAMQYEHNKQRLAAECMLQHKQKYKVGHSPDEFLCIAPNSSVKSSTVTLDQLEAIEFLFKKHGNVKKLFHRKLEKYGELAIHAELSKSIFVPFDFEARILGLSSSTTNGGNSLIMDQQPQPTAGFVTRLTAKSNVATCKLV